MHHKATLVFQKYHSNDHESGARDAANAGVNRESEIRHVEGVVVDDQGRLAGGGPKIMGYDIKTYALHFAPKSLPGKAAMAALGLATFPILATLLLLMLLAVGLFGLAFMLLGPFTSRRK